MARLQQEAVTDKAAHLYSVHCVFSYQLDWLSLTVCIEDDDGKVRVKLSEVLV